MEQGGRSTLHAAVRRAGARATRWARTLRRWTARLDVTDRHVQRHPSRRSVEGVRWAAEEQAARASVTPITPEYGFEQLLEEWGRSA
jgi:hypothetical protein